MKLYIDTKNGKGEISLYHYCNGNYEICDLVQLRIDNAHGYIEDIEGKRVLLSNNENSYIVINFSYDKEYKLVPFIVSDRGKKYCIEYYYDNDIFFSNEKVYRYFMEIVENKMGERIRALLIRTKLKQVDLDIKSVEDDLFTYESNILKLKKRLGKYKGMKEKYLFDRSKYTVYDAVQGLKNICKEK